MRINRLPPTSPFRRRAVSPPRNRLLRIQHSPFIGGYGGCCRQQTDIKVIKGRRIPRRERLIAFLGPGAALLPGYFTVRYWKSAFSRRGPVLLRSKQSAGLIRLLQTRRGKITAKRGCLFFSETCEIFEEKLGGRIIGRWEESDWKKLRYLDEMYN